MSETVPARRTRRSVVAVLAALVVTVLPCAWVGGKVREMQLRESTSA